MREARSIPHLVLILVAALLAGCATPISVKRVGPRELRLELSQSVLTGSEPSQRSRQLLDRLALVKAYDDDPAAALEVIRRGLGGPNTSERLLGLAELSFAHGDRTRDPLWYRAAAIAAYAYLFPQGDHARPSPFDPGLRLAAEFYNRGLARGFSGVGAAGLYDLQKNWELPYGQIELSVDSAELGWSGYRLRDIVPSSELEVRGLRNRYRRVGIGAALSAKVERIEGEASGHSVGKEVQVPITALLRIEDPLAAVTQGQVRAALEIYVLDQQEEVRIDDRVVPLEYEPTASLAFGLENPLIWSFELGGFFSGDFNPFQDVPDGLILLHPYRPGRVPVVLVHGTASTPARWAEMINELQGDPEIADRIQFCLFLYNTGNPVLFSGSRLRKALHDTVADLDPEGKDLALQHMVVIGHSQGGLLTKLQAVSSGAVFWDSVSDRPFAELDVSDETRDLFEPAVFFDSLPFVRRVVYISTPHGGSYQALRSIARWISGLVSLPGDIAGRLAETLTRNEDLRILNRLDRLPTSLDNMTPGNRFLVALGSLREAPGVGVHSIIPVTGAGPPAGQNDGVVAYESAHLDHALSERVIRSGHSVQANPEAIAEVKRILFDHFAELDAAIAEHALAPHGGIEATARDNLRSIDDGVIERLGSATVRPQVRRRRELEEDIAGMRIDE
ncbi:MAG: alpha/beta fold hydrolase [bacterium]|nr:alpha/beta fold hydrolase [bacterium]